MTNEVPTRTYFVKSLDEALAQARQELGSEAMLLNTRKISNEQGLPGGYEVVFSVPDVEFRPQLIEPPKAAAPAVAALPMAAQPVVAPLAASRLVATPLAAPFAATPLAATPPVEDLAADLVRLHAQMDEIRSLLMQPARVQAGASGTAPELTEIHDSLIASDVDSALSKDIVDRLGSSRAVEAELQRLRAYRERAGHRGRVLANELDTFENLVLAEMDRRVGVDPRLGHDDQSVVLVGPPGAGKSSSVAKLASFVSDFAGTRPVRVVSLAATEASAGGVPSPLQGMAEALGIPFTRVLAVQLLPSFINEKRKEELLFIDTPAYGSSNRREAKEAAAALAGCPGVDIHLVVPGYMKAIDLRRCIQKYEIFRPSKLLVTKLDETHSFGSVFSEAARAGLSLSFLAHGPMIPRDIRPASPQDLLALALEQDHAMAANVA